MSKLTDIYRQAHKEAFLAFALAVLYFLWWYATAYGLSPTTDNHTMPTLYWGFPLWFLLSCIIGPLLFTILCIVMVKVFYKDVPLDIAADEDNHE
ncbi:YhdT family protein [Vibrio tritonius]|uniref:YhdT family protein n=1 Tax=Vibrio tritonius TaxID=1435069 RepID=A0ABS7YMT4_9VIBR|nr:YhdT family protein [Vibrio tritonius]MCA2016991.1 YhdT family protein [Vibrio tritonius]